MELIRMGINLLEWNKIYKEIKISAVIGVIICIMIRCNLVQIVNDTIKIYIIIGTFVGVMVTVGNLISIFLLYRKRRYFPSIKHLLHLCAISIFKGCISGIFWLGFLDKLDIRLLKCAFMII